MNKDIKTLIEYVDSIDESSILSEIKGGEIPPIERGFSTATKEKYYKELNMKWERSSNTVVGVEIWERKYIELEFNYEDVYVKEYSLEEYDEELKGKDFYRVSYEFYEDIYRGVKPFRKWARERMVWYQEILFHNKKSKTLRWDRPYEVKLNPDGSSYEYYQELNQDFNKIIKVNNALGIVIRSDIKFNLRVGESVYMGIEESPKISPLIDDIEITFSHIDNQRLNTWIEVKEEEDNEIRETWYEVKGKALPKYIEVDIYGLDEVEGGRRYHPKGEDEEYRETLIHSHEKGLVERLSPPGIKIEDEDYWNIEDIKKTSKRYKNYKERRYKEPTWQ